MASVTAPFGDQIPEAPLGRQLRRRLRFVALLVTIVIGFGAPGTCYVLELRPTAAFLVLAALTASVSAVLVYAVPLAVVAQMEARNRRLVAERETLAMIDRRPCQRAVQRQWCHLPARRREQARAACVDGRRRLQ